MLTQTKFLTILVLVSTLSLGACQKIKTASVPQSNLGQSPETQLSSNALKPVADEWIEAETTRLIPVVDPLGQHLQAARLSYEKKDFHKTASEMKKGALLLDQEKKLVSAESQAKISEAVEALNKAAQKIKDGQVKSWKDLEPVFQQAYKADVEHVWVTATEDQWVPIIEKPEFYWRSSYDSFVRDDYLDAARDIHKGVAFVELRSHYYRGKDRDNVIQSSQTLKMLADRVKKGEITEIKILEKAFAQEHLIIAKADMNEVGKSLSEQNNVRTGHSLKAAAKSLEYAGDWVNQKPLVQLTVQEMRDSGDKLIMGNEKSVQQADSIIKSFNDTYQRLERHVS